VDEDGQVDRAAGCELAVQLREGMDVAMKTQEDFNSLVSSSAQCTNHG
jgi:hypothetical protein